MKRVRFTAVIFCSLLMSFSAFPAIAGDDESQVTRLEDITVVVSPVIEGNEIDRYAGQKKTTVTEA